MAEPQTKFWSCWGMVGPLDAVYHDTEWGVPCRDDRDLFERLMLEGFQAGLSWSTILAKRENFFRAFDGWNAETIARYRDEDIARLLADPGIVRNRLKVAGAVKNAQAYLRIRERDGSFERYIWSFIGGEPVDKRPMSFGDIPATSPVSDAMSKALRKDGFTFVGSTICYAFMQSTGMVNDHLLECPTRQA
ncbi:MAG TPA: DNA-3-methyladenine glycosylase I [Tepidiformaceae bacterium]|nr:DNA-3-methyladenine glycosylase I [Tepidiformaceae bacterium]